MDKEKYHMTQLARLELMAVLCTPSKAQHFSTEMLPQVDKHIEALEQIYEKQKSIRAK